MTPENIKKLCKAIAVFSVIMGGYGSILCVPFALTNNLSLIMTAGVYFVAGAVLISGGLLSYVHLIKAE